MSDELWVQYEGDEGPGKGKHIVFISGDEEYRSEETMPMLGRLLAESHGFKSTVLFAINPETGEIDPECQTNIPGLCHLDNADLMVLGLRFRELPDEEMKRIIDFIEAGKPVIGLRTATHSFNYTRNPDSPYAKYSFNSTEFEGGFGRQILGETWVSHHGKHKFEATRGLISEGAEGHPILRGVEDIWGPTDVYAINSLTGDSRVLVDGHVQVGMEPADELKPDTPTMPVAWIKTYTGEAGNCSRVFCTTMAASIDLECEDLRRLLVNAMYWCVGLEDQIPEKNNAHIVGEFEPTFYGFGTFKKGMRPADFRA